MTSLRALAAERLPGIDEVCKCICLAHRRICGPQDLGFEVEDEDAVLGFEVGEAPVLPSADAQTENHGLAEIDEADEKQGDPSSLRDEIQQHSAAMDVDRQAALEAERVDDASKLPDELEVLGVVVKPTDTLKVLREACTLAGLGKSGGKETVYRRLHNFVIRYDIQQRLSAQPSEPKPNEVVPPTEPSAEERRLHELTHLPFKNWCRFCQEHKSRSDMHKPTDVTQHGIPTISYDFAFTGREEDGKDKLVSLVLRDDFSGWREAIPVPRRGGGTNKSYLAGEVTRLLNMLGYSTVKLRCDPEGVCLSLREAIIPFQTRP